MNDSTIKPPVFYVGLCLAGAVSAGAYTAGVIDFLFEALDGWESKRGQPGIPTHRVKIPVIGGASAGGMTGILAASAIHAPIPPVASVAPDQLLSPIPGNIFYNTWVDLLAEDMFPLLLDTTDISTRRIYSLLNSSFIDDIAKTLMQSNAASGFQRPYIEEHLRIFTTLTNLQGLPFNIAFNSNAPGVGQYIVRNHNDFACFILNKTPDEYAHDGWMPLDFRHDVNVELAAQAAMATGAFPLGLRARPLQRKVNYVNDNSWLRDITAINPISGTVYETLNVDGGLINNEPFEKVRDVLTGITNQHDPAEYNDCNKFSSTVLMVDPFPSAAETFDSSDRLSNVIGNTLAAMISQCRIKTSTLAQAMDADKAGQFLIAPVRSVVQQDGSTAREQGYKAIACGSLSGFGGFLHKEFRIHDFFLGRANCEKFLRDHFTVPGNSTNCISDGYQTMSQAERERFCSPQGRLPIIPLVSPRRSGKYMPTFSGGHDWPVRKLTDISRFSGPVRKRAQSILLNLSEFNGWTKLLLWIGAKVVLNKKLTGAAMNIIETSLRKHQLLR